MKAFIETVALYNSHQITRAQLDAVIKSNQYNVTVRFIGAVAVVINH